MLSSNVSETMPKNKASARQLNKLNSFSLVTNFLNFVEEAIEPPLSHQPSNKKYTIQSQYNLKQA